MSYPPPPPGGYYPQQPPPPNSYYPMQQTFSTPLPPNNNMYANQTIQQPIQQQQIYPSPLGDNAQLYNWFQSVDQSRNGRISVPELNTALASAGMKFSFATTERLLAMYDSDFDGEINYNEFQAVYGFIQNMQSGFQARDTSRDGRLDGNEVRIALRSHGYNIEDATFQTLMRKFDRQKQGSLAFDDYIELSIFMGNAANVFRTRDNGSGLATFNFDNFLAAGVSLL